MSSSARVDLCSETKDLLRRSIRNRNRNENLFRRLKSCCIFRSRTIVEREEERFFSKYEISIARESLKSNGFKRLTFTMEMANDIGTKRHGFGSTVKQTERWTFHGLALQSVAQFIATASI